MRNFANTALGVGVVAAFVYLIAWHIKTPRPVPLEETVKLQNIERVLMHEPDHYTLLIRVGETDELHLKSIVLDPGSFERAPTIPIIKTDVPSEEKMWALVKYRKTVIDGEPATYAFYLELHLHSAEDMQGGGWRKRVGKTSIQQGTTQVLE